MTNKHHTLFISDLHLDASTPALNETFLHFLKTLAPKADALYILGDFFDIWIGDDCHTPFSDRIIQALADFSQHGKPLYFIRGNRDVLVGRRFAKASRLTLLNDETIIDLYGKRTLLMHGDSLCTRDEKHQRFRRLSQNPFYRFCFLRLPLFYRANMKKKYIEKRAHQNRTEYSTSPDRIMDVTPEALHEAFIQNNAELIIHGHTHRPTIETIPLKNQNVTRVVLAAWHNSGSVLRYDEDGQMALIDLPLIKGN